MNPRTMLEAASQLAQAANVAWPQYEATCAALAAPTVRSANLDTPITTGGVNDPTGTITETHEPYWETVALVHELLGVAREIQKRMTAVRSRTFDIEAEVNAARCDGVLGDDPTCTRNAVRNIDGHASCWTCISRRRRRDEQAEAS